MPAHSRIHVEGLTTTDGGKHLRSSSKWGRRLRNFSAVIAVMLVACLSFLDSVALTFADTLTSTLITAALLPALIWCMVKILQVSWPPDRISQRWSENEQYKD